MIRTVLAAALLTCATCLAQTLPAKPPAFEVVSIRPSKAGNWSVNWSTTPDGYRVTGQSLRSTILIAYFPQGFAYWTKDRLQNTPPWIDDLYDIDAKVSEADLAAWQKQGIMLDQKPLLQQMLQTMLAERCKLTSHRTPGELGGLALVVAKRGPHLTASTPGAPLPVGMKLPDGGVSVGYRRGEPVQMRFYNATLADFAQNLSIHSNGRPVQNHTNLTGHYDFTLRWADSDPDHPERDGVIQFDDPNPLSHWNLDVLGLKLEPIKLPVDTLVLDHIEKPSDN